MTKYDECYFQQVLCEQVRDLQVLLQIARDHENSACFFLGQMVKQVIS